MWNFNCWIIRSYRIIAIFNIACQKLWLFVHVSPSYSRLSSGQYIELRYNIVTTDLIKTGTKVWHCQPRCRYHTSHKTGGDGRLCIVAKRQQTIATHTAFSLPTTLECPLIMTLCNEHTRYLLPLSGLRPPITRTTRTFSYRQQLGLSAPETIAI